MGIVMSGVNGSFACVVVTSSQFVVRSSQLACWLHVQFVANRIVTQISHTSVCWPYYWPTSLAGWPSFMGPQTIVLSDNWICHGAKLETKPRPTKESVRYASEGCAKEKESYREW